MLICLLQIQFSEKFYSAAAGNFYLKHVLSFFNVFKIVYCYEEI